MYKLIMAFLGLFTLSITPVLGGTSAPFIYYEADNGYILERADGSDSHILGAGLTVEPTQSDASWSASGDWLAWLGYDFGGCGEAAQPIESLYLAGADNTQRQPFQKAAYAWSPAGDRLLLVGQDDSGISWQILDPLNELANGSIPEFANPVWAGATAILSFDTHLILIDSDFAVTETTLPSAPVDFSPQGDAIYLVDGSLIAHNILTQSEIRIETPASAIQRIDWYNDDALISTDAGWFYYASGQFKSLPANWLDWQWARQGIALAKSKEAIVMYDLAADTEQPLSVDMSAFGLPSGSLSADDHWFAYVEDGPVLLDMATNEYHRVSPVTESYEGNWGGEVFWHPSQNWLIAEEQGMAGCGQTIYTQVTDGVQRYEIPACGSQGDCVHWLPEQVNPDNFPVYEKPAQPIPVMTFHAGAWVDKLFWSGDVLQAELSDGSTVAWDVTTGADAPVFPTSPPVYSSDAFPDFGPIIGESQNYIVSLSNVYDKRTGEPVFTNLDDYDYSELGFTHFLTPDEHLMIAGADAYPLKIWSIPDGKVLYDGIPVTACTLSPDGLNVAVGLGWDVALYEIATLLDTRTP